MKTNGYELDIEGIQEAHNVAMITRNVYIQLLVESGHGSESHYSGYDNSCLEVFVLNHMGRPSIDFGALILPKI